MNRDLLANTLLSHYRIVSKIGAGGMGEVYLAQDTKLDRRVALKILPAEVAADAIRMRRFVQEAKTASGLNHPNIITIHEIDRADSVDFIATEFIDGETLRERMRHAPMKLIEVLDVAIQCASALSAAHAANILHRDIKPENIMIRGDGIVKVLDFGLAKLTESRPVEIDPEAPTSVKTDPGTVVGTAVYMSPEQARGTEMDARTDIFSLGTVVYEMVAGRVPFEGSSSSEVMASILSEKEPQPLARYSTEVPVELERIVSKALRKNREQRYQTIKDMLLDLQSLKQELEFERRLERSMPPHLGSAADTGEQASETVIRSAARPTVSEKTPTRARTFNLRSLVLAVAALLIIASATGAYFYFTRARGGVINSIAVLPFVNASNNPEMEYLSDGLSESLINSLSKLPGVKVIARTSSFQYKGKEADLQEVAQALGVEAILTGKVLQRGDSLLISAELVNSRDKTQVWGEQYSRKASDVLAVQSEIAREIAEGMRLKLTGAEQQQLAKRPTENLKAFQYYMQGRAYSQRRTREDLLAAIRYCEKAIAEDQNYALAYAGLADAYANLGLRGYIAPIEGRRKAEEAGGKAIALDENLGEAHVAQGLTYTAFAPFNFSLGDRETRRAIELSPSLAGAHQSLAMSLARQGRLDETLEEIQKARQLDPLSSIIARQAALPYYLKRDYVRALELLRQANELGPAFTSVWEIGVYIQNHSFDEALAELQKAKQERKADPILISGVGLVYGAQGKRAEALESIKELEGMSGVGLSQADYIAKIYAILNERELALTWLERGLAAEAIGAFYKDESVWDSIRSDPRFADLLRRMGIPS